MTQSFKHRVDAGRHLARELGKYADRPDALVLGIARGGVPIAAELAKALNLPFDVLIVRKLGVPGQTELAMGAIAGGGVCVINNDAMRMFGISEAEIESAIRQEHIELERRERMYRGKHPPPEVHGRTVILADDGLATGSTMRAAAEAVKEMGAEKVVIASPVGSPETCRELLDTAAEVVCPHQPHDLGAISLWYEEFPQITDEEVRTTLDARSATKHPAPALTSDS